MTSHSTKHGDGRGDAREELERARAELLVDSRTTTREREALLRTELAVSAHDDMYVPSGAAHYLGVGLSALRCLEQALELRSRARPVQRVLDFPCGHGRVMRHLVARWPQAEFVGVELVATGREFCAATFGARVHDSRPGFRGVEPGHDFDLVWCGSLATHVDLDALARLLEVLCGALAPGGVCVVTTHGARVAERLARGEESYGLDAAKRAAVLAQYESTGFGYADYDGASGSLAGAGYGTSLVTPERLLDIASTAANWRPIGHAERAWDDHQDVFAFERS